VDVGHVIVGRYEVRRVLEVGARSTLLEAIDLETDRFVVVESYRRFQSPGARELLCSELAKIASLESPRVARVYATGTEPDGSVYAVLDPPEGESLLTLLRRQGPLPLARVLEIMLQACETVAQAHAIQLVHRDLSPETLFVTRPADGSFLLQIRDYASRLASYATGTEPLFEAHRYTAPELLTRSQLADPRTDIWALGATMYELASGQRPFPQAPSELPSLLAAEPRDLHVLRPALPAPFCEAVMRCLHPSPAARYGSVGELAAAIANCSPGRGQGVSGAMRGVLAAVKARRLR
jgi:eukaryotic-like serine/threonine-protein kinase